MDYTFDRSIQERIRSISSKFDLEYWKNTDETRAFPSEYWDSLAVAGLFGILIDSKWGGMGKGIVDLSLAVEETSERYAGLGSYLYLSGSLVSRILERNGSDEQRREFLPRLAKGEVKMSIALSEERSGFDASAIETKASKSSNGSQFSLTGAKTFVNNAERADYLIIFARTSDRDSSVKKSAGVSMFLVPSNNPVIKKKKLARLGMNFVDSFAMEFKDLAVDNSSLIGQEGSAWYNMVDIFGMDRIVTAASLVGTGRLALSIAAEWAKNRIVFGRKIGSNQGIQFPLAECVALLESSEAITLKAASIADRGRQFANDASFSLLESSSAASQATDRALQTLGGHGYYSDHHVERLWRDVRAHKIHPISEELLLASIAERVLGLPKSY